MPQITTCPECSKQLRVPDDLIGRKVRCPGCSAMFTAEAAAETAPPPPPRRDPPPADHREAFKDLGNEPPRRRSRDDDDDDRRRDRDDDRRVRRDRDDDYDRRPSRRGRDDDDYDDRRPSRRDDDYDDYDRAPRGEGKSLRGVRLGINLNVIASWMILGMVALSILFVGIAFLIGASVFAGMASRAGGGAAPAGPPAGGAVALILSACLFYVVLLGMGLTSSVLVLVGMGMCMQTPRYPRNSARGLAIAAFSCAAAAVGLYLVGTALNIAIGVGAARTGGGPPIGGCVSIFAYPAGLAGFILWLFYLRSLSFAMRNSEVAGKVMAVFIGYMVYFVVCVLFVIVMIAVFAAAFASMFRGGQGPTPGSAAGAIGGAFIFMLVMYGLIILAGLGMQVWYTLVLQRVRDVVDRYLARL